MSTTVYAPAGAARADAGELETDIMERLHSTPEPDIQPPPEHEPVPEDVPEPDPVPVREPAPPRTPIKTTPGAIVTRASSKLFYHHSPTFFASGDRDGQFPA